MILNNSKGITVMNLVITIIVLTILSGITLNFIGGNNGLLTNAGKAEHEIVQSQMKEELELDITDIKINHVTENEKLEVEDLNGYDGELSSKDTTIIWITDKIGIQDGNYFEIDENFNVNFVEFSYNYDSISEMKDDYLSLKPGDTVTTKAYYKNGPLSGSGIYEIVENNGSFKEDGGIYIKLNNNYNLWAVLKVYDDTIDLHQYGAYGDGVNDDTQYIKNAFNSNASTIHISEGRYVVSSKINIPSNKTILGVSNIENGIESLFIAKENLQAGADIFNVNENSENITLKRISISGNSSVNNKDAGHSDFDGIHLLDFWNCRDILVESCTFKDNIYVAIRLMGGNNINIRNSNFLEVDCGIISLGKIGVKNLYIENNIFEGHDNSEPVALWSENAKFENINIIGNKMLNKIYANTILFRDTNEYKDVIIENNTSFNMACGFNLCNISGKSRIINNKIESTTSGNGVILKNCKDIIIDNLFISEAYSTALEIENSQNLKITNLNVNEYSYRNSDFCAINLDGDGSGTQISGNISCTNKSLGDGLKVYGSNYDFSGLKFNMKNGKNAIGFYTNAINNVFHSNQNVAIVYQAKNLENDIVINNTAFLLKGTDFNSYFYRFVKIYEVERLNNSNYSLSTMYACQNGFERELIIHANVRVNLVSSTGMNEGDIIWLQDRVINQGKIEIIHLVCNNGVWYEIKKN